MEIVLASLNKGKLAEMQDLLADLPVNILLQSQFSEQAAEETGASFVENAILKARFACEISGHAAIADDSGICVPALGGEPGIYSARYAGEPSDDQRNNRKLLDAMNHLQGAQRRAYYFTAVVFMRHAKDPTPLIAQGYWHGEIATAPKGSGGFGYDPLFCIGEQNRTAAELEKSEKQRLSHRGQALRELKAQLLQTL